jgi:lambda repressor-like predicted transcriptional regulator
VAEDAPDRGYLLSADDFKLPGLRIMGDGTPPSGAEVSRHYPRPPENKTNERKSFIAAILNKKGMSRHDWAKKSGVDFHTVTGYLKGRKSYPSTREKIAKSLGLEPNDSPR